MKIDEIIIKLCSERGYDPSQVNDYPTLLEQFECIKELLKTYPNQQYYTVKAYTYTASTKKFSFKISDVNNYGRQINIGDILIVTLANNILEIAQISSLDVEAGNGIADDVGQLTGSKGETGETGAKGDNGLPALTYGSLITVQTIPQVGNNFSWAPMFASGFNRTPVVGDILNVLVNYKSNSDSYMCTIKVTEYTSPTLKGTYVNVTEATGKVGNTIKLEQNQTLKIVNPFNAKYIEIGNNKMDFSPVATRFSVNSLDYRDYAKNNYGPNIKTEDGVVASTGLNLQWLGLNMYYEISDVPTSTTSGTLPDNASWTYLTTHPDDLRLLFNNEFYQFSDNQHIDGKLVFSHVGYENDELIVKTITITISTRAWLLSVIKPVTHMAVQGLDVYSNTEKTNLVGLLVINIPCTYNSDIDALVNMLGDMSYLSCTGYVNVNNVKYPILYADQFDPGTGTIYLYTAQNTNGTAYYINNFSPDYVTLT